MRSTSRYLSAATLLAAFYALPAAATHVEIQGGRSYSDSHGTNALFLESVFNEYRIGDSRFSWSPDVSLGWINGRNVNQFENRHPGDESDAWVLAAGARFHYGDSSSWYHPLFFSFQPAFHTGNTQALSSPYEFVSTLGWQGRHVSFQVRHVSNGGIHDPNRGETMALVGLGFDL